ncbi:hypothetical protein CCHR01_12836 [Colletotrichum chrysophilum]|uniref:Uncharacterized protein n=1 Tax=Colletotrichum chrysophilum TaxID=1836956 RepID=A0AAD9AAK1_9PEZI|nr:hypothetical protein CCHR01_12836 [Colletotrichum chrysophilum]
MQRARLIFWGAGLLSIANAQSTASITAPARFFFVYDSHPTGSLEASVVSYDPTDTTYQVACPTANEACQNEGYYPVNITHHQGSLWAGTNTATAGTTKFWSCDLGTGSDDVLSDQYGWCSVGTTSGSSTMTGARSPVNMCFVEARSVVVAITAGLDKLGANKGGAREASYLLSVESEKWRTQTCQPFSSPTPTESSEPTTSLKSATAGATDGASQPAETASRTAAPSESAPPSGSSRTLTRVALALIMSASVAAVLL